MGSLSATLGWRSYLIQSKMMPSFPLSDSKHNLMLSILFLLNFGNIHGGCNQGGLPCWSLETLTPEQSFLIETQQCGNQNKYPNNWGCTWQFDVMEGCQPSISCSYFDVKGEPAPSGCDSGDSMHIYEVENYENFSEKSFCSDLGSLSYTSESDQLRYFDINFNSNR